MNWIFPCSYKHLRRHYRPLHLTLNVRGTGKNGYDNSGGVAGGGGSVVGGGVCAVVVAVMVVLKQSKLLTAKCENWRN